MFIAPMMAQAFDRNQPNLMVGWFAEEKMDGHRLIVSVTQNARVDAWSRNKEPRALPQHLMHDLSCLRSGVYDGELVVPGGASYDVTALQKSDQLAFYAFDMLYERGGFESMTGLAYSERRKALTAAFDGQLLTYVHRVVSTKVTTHDDVRREFASVIALGGEGLVLKEGGSYYYPGKRTRGWLKMKESRSEVMTVVALKDGSLGPNTVAVVKDSAGVLSSVKARNDHERYMLEAHPEKAIGRRLVVEYHMKTPDGKYRHPRWDRWAEEGE